MPDEGLPDTKVINIVKKKTGLDEPLVGVGSINSMIEKKKIISINGRHTGKLFLRKNQYR
jgi:hypothetical protein